MNVTHLTFVPLNSALYFVGCFSQITPTYVSDQLSQIDWLHYLKLWEDLGENHKRVGQAVGVEERFLIRAMKGTVSLSTPRQSRQMAVHRRFYTALALNDLINEVPLSKVRNHSDIWLPIVSTTHLTVMF